MASFSHAEGRQLDPGQVYTMWAPSVRRAAQRAVAVVTHMRADANARRFSVPPRAYGRVRWLHIPSVYARGQRVNGSVASIRHAHRHMCVPHGCSDRGVVVWVCVWPFAVVLYHHALLRPPRLSCYDSHMWRCARRMVYDNSSVLIDELTHMICCKRQCIAWLSRVHSTSHTLYVSAIVLPVDQKACCM